MKTGLRLEGLFTPRLLEAFRRSWGLDQLDSERVFQKVLSIFELHPGGKKNGVTARVEARRRRFLRILSMAIVGEEPTFHAWLEAFAVGNFDLPNEVMYGGAPDKGSPSLFLRRQRLQIEKLIDPAASPEEQELQRRAYLDAIRLILASLVVRELGRAVAAKAAIGQGWPIMVAAERLKAREKQLLHHFGKDDEFLGFLAVRVEQALQGWIDEHLGGHQPVLGRSRSYVYSLPTGMNVHAALTYLDRTDIAVDGYRASLWAELGDDQPPMPITGSGRTSSAVAVADAERLRRLIANVDGLEGSPTLEPSMGSWVHFREAREESEPFNYTPAAAERLRRLLIILRNEKPLDELVNYARFRADLRRALRTDSPGAQRDEAVQIEIVRWVDSGLPPPASLRMEHATYYEEEVCRRVNQIKRDDRWRAAGLFPPGSDLAEVPF